MREKIIICSVLQKITIQIFGWGTFNAGFHQFKKKNDEYAFVRNYFSGNTDLINQFVISLQKGSGNDIWLGHFGGGEGVSRFVPGKEFPGAFCQPS
jgi:hypothetical protein